MKFGLPPWAKRTKDAALEVGRALVTYSPPPVADLTDADQLNGWTPEALAEYHAERNAAAMSIVAASMDARRRPPRPRWANNRYDPLHWRG